MRKENATFFGQLRVLDVFWCRLRKDVEVWKSTDNPGGNWENFANQIADVNIVQKRPVLKGVQKLPQRRTESRWQKTCDPTQKPHLKGSVNDICMLDGGDFESRQDSATIVLTPRVSFSRVHVADNLSDCDQLAERHASARASTVVGNLSSISATDNRR